MCAVKLSEEEIFVIGGFDGANRRNEVWIYDPKNEFEKKPGPPLNTNRSYHACSTMRDGEKTLIVVAGGVETMWDEIDSVEIYDPTDNIWHSGKRNYKNF